VISAGICTKRAFLAGGASLIKRAEFRILKSWFAERMRLCTWKLPNDWPATVGSGKILKIVPG